MTKTEERRFYRHAVQASLRQFYGKSEAEANRLVKAWWKRLSQAEAFSSELFLHSEPINTAAGIAEAKVIRVTSRNRQAYHQILNESRILALTFAKPKTTFKKLSSRKSPDSQRQRSISATRS